DIVNGKLYLNADSDAFITKGIIALLIRVLSGQNTGDVVNSDLYFIDAIGLKSHLSPTRSNGLKSMVQQIKTYAGQRAQTNVEEGADTGHEKKDKMIAQIKQVFDPEIPVDIWELGLIYSLDIDKD